MGAEIVNLRQARKKKARTEREAEAAANRTRFGRTKAEKSLTKARDDKARRDIDAHRRDRDASTDEPSGD
ncbi:MAG: DUF4169 domain-containing protein [Hyphomicrobiales bacterium]|nr:MAG: DUF4169 domain-containing protein [Hyphomicrobiales bacterium]